MAHLDLDLGRSLRDEGMERVLCKTGDWRHTARLYIASLRKGREVTGEDIRIGCEKAGIIPHNPNAWGGVINGAIRSGLLVKTGRYTQMKDPRSHARATQILRRA